MELVRTWYGLDTEQVVYDRVCIIHTSGVKVVITSLVVKELKPTCWLITPLTPEV